ncbi:TonB-dependent receptor plug domain-containing protein [Flavobacterium aestuarii]|uniref:TonB-dependent receptor plug domain-containing protein n=1 Tax=Flavobacterium aestuarii TaxID=3149227 RepID=UPI0032B5956C
MKKIFLILALVCNSVMLFAQEPVNDTIKDSEELDEIVVKSTRTSRTISNTPTRIEAIDAEELDEKNNMRPANVSMVLHESTGIQVQQTSATNGNASVRLQGLDGRYTQLLKDSYPNFGNFASGLSILEIPPLDLQQVEIIKGPSSTLYGGGAIAGVVNFISKTPKEKGEYNFLINQSNVGQTNIGGYASQKKGKFGYTLLALYNNQSAYDVDHDNFSELPEAHSFTVNPQLFYYPDESVSFMLGNSFLKGSSLGGDMQVIKGNPSADNVYFEENKTIRNTTVFEFDKKFSNDKSFKLKQSLSIFDRKISIPAYSFSGQNTNSFTDASYVFHQKQHNIISGLNFVYDNFDQSKGASANNSLNAKSITAGVYAQDTWDAAEKIKLEYGARLDNVSFSNINYKKNQTFILPRISGLYKINNQLSTRLGGGLGYKIPTAFTEQTETIQYQNVLPLNNVEAEKSIGGTLDFNYKAKLADELLFSINQMFFLTQINKPLVLEMDSSGNSFFINASKPITSNGFETNVKFIFKENYKLFGGYTFANAKNTYLETNQFMPLVPKNKVNLTLVYEKEDDFKIGLESYYTDKQFLYNGQETPSYWEFGASAQKTFGKVTVFINFENFTDERQSKYKGVVNPPYTSPSFDDIWNHTEGFVFNGGLKIKL